MDRNYGFRAARTMSAKSSPDESSKWATTVIIRVFICSSVDSMDFELIET